VMKYSFANVYKLHLITDSHLV